MNHVRRRRRSGRLAWVLAAALTLGSSAPAMAVDTKRPTPTPTPSPSPEPSPTPTPPPSPEPSPTPSQTPSPQPTSAPPPDSTPAPDPPPGVDTGFIGPVLSPDALASPQAEDGVGLEEPGTESVHQHADAAGASETSLIESVTSILDQLASVDVPVGGPRFPCDVSGCGSPLSTTRSKALALASICIILAVVGAFGVRGRRRRSFADSSDEDA